jgi:transcriptional regulator with XRE-family HTH domain
MSARAKKVATGPQAGAPSGEGVGTIGGRIRDRLAELGMTRQQLADAVGEGDRVATVYEWLRDDPGPQVRHLARLSAALQVTMGELIGVDEDLEPPFAAWARFLESEEAEEITADERRTLAAVVWPRGREPTVLGYQMMLAALRSGTRDRRLKSGQAPVPR